MPQQDVLNALTMPENEPIEAMLGSSIRSALNKDGWEEIVLLQHLSSALNRLKAWNDLLTRVRNALARPQEFTMKANQLLGTTRISEWNDKLDDFVAEMLAAIYLAECGHQEIHFLSEIDPITVDIRSIAEGQECFTEVKNLREPRSLSFVAFRHWHMLQATRPEHFAFQAEFLDIDDPLDSLTA